MNRRTGASPLQLAGRSGTNRVGGGGVDKRKEGGNLEQRKRLREERSEVLPPSQPKPYTPKLEAQDPKPETRKPLNHPIQSTSNPKPSTINPEPHQIKAPEIGSITKRLTLQGSFGSSGSSTPANGAASGSNGFETTGPGTLPQRFLILCRGVDSIWAAPPWRLAPSSLLL